LLEAEPTPRHLWRVIAAGAALAITAVLALALWPTAPRLPTLVEGALASGAGPVRSGSWLSPEAQLETPAEHGAAIAVPDGSVVTVAPQTRFAFRDRSARVWELRSGRLDLVVAPRGRAEALQVSTAEAVVVVVGTEFAVARNEQGDASETHISVRRGTVEVLPRSGGERILRAGEALALAGEAPQPSSISPPDLPKPPFAPGTDAPFAGRVSHAPSKQIRARLAQGDIRGARRLIAETKNRATGKDVLAELGILAAEADLAERKVAAAFDKYLLVSRTYVKTLQAEDALFAAAQLAIDEPSLGHSSAALLRQLIEAYPEGRFAPEARRLLEAIEKSPP
jgi:hypothetical protein